MSKKETTKLLTAISKWDDTVTEKEVVEKFGVSTQLLQKLRREKVIKQFRYTAPSKPGSKGCPGKKPVYSLTEITELFCPQATA